MKLKGAVEPGCSTTYVVLAQSQRQFRVHDIIAVAYGDDFCGNEVMKVVNMAFPRHQVLQTKPDTVITHQDFALRALPVLLPFKNNT